MKISTRHAFLLLAFFALFCTGCAKKVMKESIESPVDTALSAMEFQEVSSSRHAPPPDAKSGKVEQEEQIILYEAKCSLSVKSVNDSVKSLEKLIASHGGYVESLNTSDSFTTAEMVLRVPVKSFEKLLADLATVGMITGKTVSATNVTDEYSDLKLRLSSSEIVLARLNKLLQQETKAEEKVKILREIERITAEMESLKARLAFLRSRADYSVVTVTLTAERKDIVRRHLPSSFGWIRNLSPYSKSIINKKPGAAFATPQGYFDMSADFYKNNAAYLYVPSGEQGGIRAGVIENYPRADLQFWTKALESDFANRLYTTVETASVRADSGMDMHLLTCRAADEKFYSVAFAVQDKKILVVEAVYEKEELFSNMKQHFTALLKSARWN